MNGNMLISGACLMAGLLATVPVRAQQHHTEKEMLASAYTLYLDGDYARAGRIYAELLSLKPDNVTYNYYYGVCVLESGSDREEAIPHLETAAADGQVPSNVHYYLAKAYHQQYRFDEAIGQYGWLMDHENRIFLEDKRVAGQLEACRRALETDFLATGTGVTGHEEVNAGDFGRTAPFLRAGGHFLTMTERVAQKKNISRFGQLIYVDGDGRWMTYSGPGKKGQSEIFLARRKSRDSWFEPVMVRFDGDPAMDKVCPTVADNGTTLYFSSDGHTAIGGLDIFMSRFNSSTHSWSTPERLPAPVNTPSDDYYYLPLPEPAMAVFCSDRESAAGQTGVFTVRSGMPDAMALPVAAKAEETTPEEEVPEPSTSVPDNTGMADAYPLPPDDANGSASPAEPAESAHALASSEPVKATAADSKEQQQAADPAEEAGTPAVTRPEKNKVPSAPAAPENRVMARNAAGERDGNLRLRAVGTATHEQENNREIPEPWTVTDAMANASTSVAAAQEMKIPEPVARQEEEVPDDFPADAGGEKQPATASSGTDLAAAEPLSMEGFFYSIDEPKVSGAQIVVEKDGMPVAHCQTDPYPSGGAYSLSLPSAGSYLLKVTKTGGPELIGRFSVDDAEGTVCRQLVTYKDSLEQAYLAVLGCGEEPHAAVRYAVQVGAFKTRTETEIKAAFAGKGIDGVTMLNKNDFRVFVTGLCDDFYSALKTRQVLIEKGVPDAFVVAISDTGFIPLDEAVLASR